MKPTRINALDPYDWDEILATSQSEGHTMLARLVSDYRAGTNRFDAPGETLYAHLDGARVIAVAGLSREQDPRFRRAGRIRRLYVLRHRRGMGLGRSLLEQLTETARAHFDTLTVNASRLDARGFYEHLGFKPVEHPGITHVKGLKSDR
jgi:GNAT superfamily N-acetyltransferase